MQTFYLHYFINWSIWTLLIFRSFIGDFFILFFSWLNIVPLLKKYGNRNLFKYESLIFPLKENFKWQTEFIGDCIKNRRLLNEAACVAFECAHRKLDAMDYSAALSFCRLSELALQYLASTFAEKLKKQVTCNLDFISLVTYTLDGPEALPPHFLLKDWIRFSTLNTKEKLKPSLGNQWILSNGSIEWKTIMLADLDAKGNIETKKQKRN